MASGTKTKISVRALAFGGKFIGDAVKFAKIDIYKPGASKKPIASGLTDQGLVEGTDGSGVTALIMGQPYPWGYPVRADQATDFTAEIPLTEPSVLTFVATSRADPSISVSVNRLVLPGVPLTGNMAVVVVVPGLLVDLVTPATKTPVAKGTSTTITAQVRMMCGCKVDNLFWPAGNFDVQAIISHGGKSDALSLSYLGEPSLFSADYVFPKPGTYEIQIVATEINGNSGSAGPVTVKVAKG